MHLFFEKLTHVCKAQLCHLFVTLYYDNEITVGSSCSVVIIMLWMKYLLLHNEDILTKPSLSQHTTRSYFLHFNWGIFLLISTKQLQLRGQHYFCHKDYYFIFIIHCIVFLLFFLLFIPKDVIMFYIWTMNLSIGTLIVHSCILCIFTRMSSISLSQKAWWNILV